MKQIYKFTNKKGEKIEVWLTSTVHNKKNKHGLMNLWTKNGYIKEFIPDWVLENTEENKKRILNEIKRMANA